MWFRMGLAEALEQIRQQGCTALSIGCNGIGTEGAKELAAALKGNAILTYLDLNGNEIGAGAKELVAALMGNTTLTWLWFNNNKIGDKGAKELAAALKANASLTTLDLTDNAIGDEGAQELAAALEANTTITTLDLNRNKVNDQAALATIQNRLKANDRLVWDGWSENSFIAHAR